VFQKIMKDLKVHTIEDVRFRIVCLAAVLVVAARVS
jgi:hypothetical protein